MGQAGRHRVQKEFNLELMVQRTMDIYEQVGAREINGRLESNGDSPPEITSHVAMR
jgi:hypothetical protein